MDKLCAICNAVAWTLLIVSLGFNYAIWEGKIYREKPDYITELTKGK